MTLKLTADYDHKTGEADPRVICTLHPDARTGFKGCACHSCEEGYSTNHRGTPVCYTCTPVSS